MKKNSFLSKLVSLVLLPVLGFTGLLMAAASPQTETAFAVGPAAPSVFPNDPGISYSLTPIITSGLTRPIFITHAKDDRLFIIEQGGLVKIWQGGALLPTAFLSVTNLVLTNNSSYSEEGLLGLAFEPNYTSTGRFYIYYTNANGDENIARYTVSAGNPNVADALSATILMTISHPTNGNHNGGWLGFGPDSFLYAAVGDGGGSGDPFCAAQNTSDRRGKLLRLNVAGQLTYTTPATNTFTATQLSEVWAIGLRNPWRNSFDRQTGDLYIGDVGQGAWEEVNFVSAGASAGLNFGWSQREGRNAFSSGCPSSNITATEPFTDYAHNTSGGYSVTGGYVYRGVNYPWLNGAYFFGDYGTGHVWTAWQPGAPGIFSTAKITSAGFNISSFGEDAAGEIYLADYAGKVLRLSSIQGTPSTSTPTPSMTNTPIPTLTVTPTSTSINTPTPTSTSINTPTPTSTSINTPTPTQTIAPTPTNTQIPAQTPTNTPVPGQTNTPAPTPTLTLTPIKTNTPTTPQPTTLTPTKTNTPVVSVTQTQTPTKTLTPAPTAPTPLATSTNTPAPPPSSTPTITQTGLPDLKIGEMRFSIQLDGSGCYSSKNIGTYVSVQNSGFANAGPFSVTFNGSFTLPVTGGLQAGQSALLWFDSYPVQASATADSGNEVTESDETNNTLTQLLPIPTPPLSCKTATPGPTQPPTFTPIPTIKIPPGPISPRVSLPLVLADLVVKH